MPSSHRKHKGKHSEPTGSHSAGSSNDYTAVLYDNELSPYHGSSRAARGPASYFAAGSGGPSSSGNSNYASTVGGPQAQAATTAGFSSVEALTEGYCSNRFSGFKVKLSPSLTVQGTSSKMYAVPTNCNCPTSYWAKASDNSYYRAGTCMDFQTTALSIPTANGYKFVVLDPHDPFCQTSDVPSKVSRNNGQRLLMKAACKKISSAKSAADLVEAVESRLRAKPDDASQMQKDVCDKVNTDLQIIAWGDTQGDVPVPDQISAIFEHLQRQTPEQVGLPKKK